MKLFLVTLLLFSMTGYAAEVTLAAAKTQALIDLNSVNGDLSRADMVNAIERAGSIDLLRVYGLINKYSSSSNHLVEKQLIWALDGQQTDREVYNGVYSTYRMEDYLLPEGDLVRSQLAHECVYSFREDGSKLLSDDKLSFLAFVLKNAPKMDVKDSRMFIYAFESILGHLACNDYSAEDLKSIKGLIQRHAGPNNGVTEMAVIEALLLLPPGALTNDLLQRVADIMTASKGQNRGDLAVYLAVMKKPVAVTK